MKTYIISCKSKIEWNTKIEWNKWIDTFNPQRAYSGSPLLLNLYNSAAKNTDVNGKRKNGKENH